jgi:transposase
MARPGPRTIYRYSREFKATAVRLSQIPGVAVGDVAESLYIHPFMLSLWRKQVREGVIVTKGVVVDKEVAADLKELRKVKKVYEWPRPCVGLGPTWSISIIEARGEAAAPSLFRTRSKMSPTSWHVRATQNCQTTPSFTPCPASPRSAPGW